MQKNLSAKRTMRSTKILMTLFFLLFMGCKKEEPVKTVVYPSTVNQGNDSSYIYYDYSYIKTYKQDFDFSKFTIVKENKYSKFLIIPKYITDDEITKLSVHIDTVINRLCVYLNTSIAKEYSGFKGKVSYFIEPNIVPRTYGGSLIPIASIVNDGVYAHETVHLFTMNTSSQWLIEGIAVHLADSLGVEDLWPNFAEDLHAHAKRFISNQTALNYIGVPGFFPADPTTSFGEAFYSLSGSFVRYLSQHLGKRDFLNCYSSYDIRSTMFTLTNKSLKDWEDEWLEFLKKLP